MTHLSSVAPQIGAALGAGLMVLSAIAFQAGAKQGVSEVDTQRIQPAAVMDTPSGPDAQWSHEARAIPIEADSESRSVDQPPNDDASGLPIPFRARMPRLAIIIDDVGDMQTAQALWALDIQVTVSVLPYGPDARRIAQAANGREVFLHLPMEPVGLEDPGPYALTKSLARDAVEARVRWALDQVPGASGFNNHMGSRMTADGAAMERVFSAFEGHQDQLVFVDSLTHPGSLAREAAEEAGFIAVDRDVFLDHDPSPEAIHAQLQAALVQALETGDAIAIGHPRPDTIAALRTLSVRAEEAGVEIVTVGALVRD